MYFHRVDPCELLEKYAPIVDDPLPIPYVHVAVRDIKRVHDNVSKDRLQKFFPQSEIIYWTDEMIWQFVFAEWRDLWDALPYKIMKIDMARYMIQYFLCRTMCLVINGQIIGMIFMQ